MVRPGAIDMARGRVKVLPFNLELEYGIRTCKGCAKRCRGLYVVNYVGGGGGFSPSRYSVCVDCAVNRLKDMSAVVRSAVRDEKAFMLGVAL